MAVRTCSKSCAYYNAFRNLLDLCSINRDTKLSWPYSDDRVDLGQPCRYGLTEEQIQEIKRRRDSKLEQG